MAIIRYIPHQRLIRDFRTDKGGYYEAKCEFCGGEFYPKRKDALYCSDSCMKLAIKKDREEEKKTVKEPNNDIKTDALNEKAIYTFRGYVKVYKWLKGKYSTHGDKKNMFDKLKSMDLGDYYNYGKHKIKRVSNLIYAIYKS